MTDHRNSLQPGYKLHWYLIKRVLGQGGFGITYLAEDTNLHQLVAIKEYLPVEMAVREGNNSIHPVSGEVGEQYKWGLDRFISEAQTLARFKHPNIVRVFTVFPENNTAYMIMEYEHGKGLHEILKDKKTLPEKELMEIMLPIMDGLEQVHAAGFIHRDIKPPNIFIREDGNPVLLDFGSARQSLGQQTRTLTTLISPGFAPFEQYVSKSDKQGPWTDIYGLGATMYRATSGRSPADAMDRSEALLHTSRDIYVPAVEICPQGYSRTLLAAIDQALAFKANERPQSIAAWRVFFTETTTLDQQTMTPAGRNEQSEAATAVAAQTGETVKININADAHVAVTGDKPAGKSGRYLKLTLLLICAVLIVLGLLSRSGRHDKLDVNSGQPAVVQSKRDTTGIAATPGTEDAAPDTINKVDIVPQREIPSLISAEDRRQLSEIRRRLQANPGDERARRMLRQLTGNYESKIKQALDDNDLDLAQGYLEQMLQIAPHNVKLTEALQKIREKRNK